MVGEESTQICVIVSILVCVCSVVAAQAFVLCCCYYFFLSPVFFALWFGVSPTPHLQSLNTRFYIQKQFTRQNVCSGMLHNSHLDLKSSL